MCLQMVSLTNSPMEKVEALKKQMGLCSDNILNQKNKPETKLSEACFKCDDDLRAECNGVCKNAKLGISCTNECWKSWKYGRSSCKSI